MEVAIMDPRTFRGVPCPKCRKKGLSHANHPHAFGHKDYTRVSCRYCYALFPNSEKMLAYAKASKQSPTTTEGGK